MRERGWTVSGRMASLLKPGTTATALSLRLDHDDGSMKGFITTVISQHRLGAILGSRAIPEAWTGGLYDRKLQPIVAARGAETSSNIPVPKGLAARLAAGNPNETVEGLLEGVNERGIPVLVAYRSSGATNWTTVVAVPLALVDAPVSGVLWQVAGPAAFLLNTVEASVPASKVVHVILDNYAAHKHPRVRAWLSRHPRWIFHFTPTSASWINAVETFFSALTRRRLRRGDFRSLVDLQTAINRYIAEHNDDPRPFTWTKSAKAILNKVNRNAEPAE